MALVRKYNQVEKKYELVPADWELQYNVTNGRYAFAPPGSRPTYNATSGKHELRPAGNWQPRYNAPADKFELADKDWTEQYDPVEGKWRLLPKNRK